MRRESRKFAGQARTYRKHRILGVQDILGQRHVIGILLALQDREIRFNELMRTVDVSSNTLRSRLLLLEQEGLVTRKVHSVIPPEVSYKLTEKGSDLTGALGILDLWRKRWDAKAVVLAPAEPAHAGRAGPA